MSSPPAQNFALGGAFFKFLRGTAEFRLERPAERKGRGIAQHLRDLADALLIFGEQRSCGCHSPVAVIFRELFSGGLSEQRREIAVVVAEIPGELSEPGKRVEVRVDVIHDLKAEYPGVGDIGGFPAPAAEIADEINNNLIKNTAQSFF